MNAEKNVLKFNTITVTGNLHVGDIQNFIVDKSNKVFVIIIVSMNQPDLAAVLEKKMISFKVSETNQIYKKDDSDFDDDLEEFYNSCFKDVISIDYYHESSSGWKPFSSNNGNANNISDILNDIFKKRSTEVLCLFIESDFLLSHLIEDDDIDTFYQICTKAVLVFDPLSLSHQSYKSFIEGIREVRIGGVISPICTLMPNNVKRFSKLLLKRITYQWHINAQMPDQLIFFSVPDRENFTRAILATCQGLGFETGFSFNKSHKIVDNNTRRLG